MLNRVRDLNSYSIGATDGEIGRVRDVYFEDRWWRLRYIVVTTSHWLPGRQVLISPLFLRGIDAAHHVLHADLTKIQVARSPGVDTATPASHQHELELLRYYGFPYCWTWSGLPHGVPDPAAAGFWRTSAALNRQLAASAGVEEQYDARLRSARAGIGYYVHTVDADVGHVADFLFDEGSWTVRYIAVTTGNWWPRHKVLVPVPWLAQVNWLASTVNVKLTSEVVRTAPLYDPSRPLSAEYEARLMRYYGPPPFSST